MLFRFAFLVVLSFQSTVQLVDNFDELVNYVSTFVGSDSKYEISNGNTYPSVATPWGMNFWTL